MNFLDSLGQMFGGGGGQPAPMDNPYQVQDAYQRAMAQKQQAMQMQNPQYMGGGKAGVLAGLLGILKGKSLDRKADETITQALGRQFEMEQQRSAAEAEKARIADEKKWARELERIEAIEREKAKHRPVNAYDAWLAKQTPEKIDEAYGIRAGFKARPGAAPVVNVNTGGPAPTPFEKELDKKDATYFAGLRDAATVASQTLDQLKVMEDVMATAKTGKIPQAMAMAGQYFGTEAGTDLQTFQSASNRMVLDLAGKMKGALSDSDRRMLEQSVPSYGMDPKANQIVLGLIKKAAQNAQSTYQAADQYATQKRSLRGFVPQTAVNLDFPSPTAGGGDEPPMPGARKAADGKWYVFQDGKYMLVEAD